MSIEPPMIELIESLKKFTHDLRILYVEDDQQIREQYAHFLSKLFLVVDTAEDGQKGLEMALATRYDIIISDIKMPVLDGISMLEQIKWRYPDQATLLITAYKEIDYLHNSIEIGVDGYIYKPIEQTKTIETLHKIASNIQMKRELEHHKHHLEEMLENKNKELMNVYTTDHITGLSSLIKLEQDIKHYPNYSLGLLKIKNFKNLNDLYGYEKGNQLLQKTARFLETVMNTELYVPHLDLYRLSGAHFAILSNIDTHSLQRFIYLIIQKFESTEFLIDNHPMLLEMDAGLSGSETELSISHADAALREAEENGTIVIYKQDTSIVQERTNMLHCEDQIKRAIKEDRFVPYYQPIVDNKTKKIYKYEALARLELSDEQKSIIFPSSFIPVAKKTKTYHMITRMIILKALNDFRDSECMISLNISILDIKHIPTFQFIINQVSHFPEPRRIIFELLESEGVGLYEDAQHFFTEIKKFGCRVAIDDFGSGYSNFEHLSNLNIDYVKIDGSLILKLNEDNLSYVVVEMISSIASKMGFKTIAEFVCNESISATITKLGIDESQGFLYGKAMPYNDTMKHINPAQLAIHQ